MGEAPQIECSAGLGKNGSETFGVTTRGESVDKTLEDTMHAVTAVLREHFSSTRRRNAMKLVVAAVQALVMVRALLGPL
jgi:hypothetical protein